MRERDRDREIDRERHRERDRERETKRKKEREREVTNHAKNVKKKTKNCFSPLQIKQTTIINSAKSNRKY